MENYSLQAENALKELLAAAKCEAGDILVVGCSTSEVLGERIGTQSAPEVALAIMQGLLPLVRKAGLFLAAQCCEHLNRALVVEKAALQHHRLQRVNALPQPKAGGSFATTAWQLYEQPVLVSVVQATAALDIGNTLIGMHLQPVAVPLRLQNNHIGQATLTAARSRAPFVGGARAVYDETLL